MLYQFVPTALNARRLGNALVFARCCTGVQGNNSAIIHFCRIPGLWHSLCFLSDQFYLVVHPNNSIFYMHQYLFELDIESSSGKLPNAMLGINSRYLICLFCHGITREQTSPDHEATGVSIVLSL